MDPIWVVLQHCLHWAYFQTDLRELIISDEVKSSGAINFKYYVSSETQETWSPSLEIYN